MLEVLAIKTDAGAVIAKPSVLKQSYISSSELRGYLFDGVRPEQTFDKAWMSIPTLPEKCQKIIPAKKITTGYTLKPEFTETEATPRNAPTDWFNDEHDNNGYYALYEAEIEEIPEQHEDTEFSLEVLATVEDFNLLRGFSYEVRHGQWPNTEPKYTIDEKYAQHQLFDKIFFPKPLLSTRPCKLSSYESYQIIRNHIKDNIDRRYAEITSDYDFCMTVVKRIKLAESIAYQVERGTKRKKILVTEHQSQRHSEVYRVAPIRKDGVYEGYPPCPSFEGANYRELEENIQKYLDEIMAEINRPLVECSCCKGLGVVVEDIAQKDERK